MFNAFPADFIKLVKGVFYPAKASVGISRICLSQAGWNFPLFTPKTG